MQLVRPPRIRRSVLEPHRRSTRSHWLSQAAGCALLGSSLLHAQPDCEDFSTEPVSAARFEQVTAGTESEFRWNQVSQNLTAVLDVDQSPAYYLSRPFTQITETNDFSFSMRFRVEGADDQKTPTAFLGLMTAQHVEAAGDGLTLLLSTDDAGGLKAKANVDQQYSQSGGSSIPIEAGVEYRAFGFYEAATRQFTVEILSAGGDSPALIGFSQVTLAPASAFRVDRIGLQNGGAENRDEVVGSITVTVDDLCRPASIAHRIEVADTRVMEGDAAATALEFKVRLSPGSSRSVSATGYTVPRNGPGAATAGADYEPVQQDVVFPPGATEMVMRVPVLGDRLDEDDETVTLVLTNAVNATLERAWATGEIQDNDPLPSVALSSQGDVESAVRLLFPVTLSAPSGRALSVDYETRDGTATAPDDYGATRGTLRLEPGATSANIPVPLANDLEVEADQTFQLVLDSPTNVVLGTGQATGTIYDDDRERRITIRDAGAGEGDDGDRREVRFELELIPAHTASVSVDYGLVSGTARGNEDFVAGGGTITFQASQTKATLPVQIIGDGLPEPDETFEVLLSNPTENVKLARTRATGTITNDDAWPQLRVEGGEMIEGNDGQPVLAFRLRLDPVGVTNVTVDYHTENGLALAGKDYASLSNQVVIPAGTASREVTVPVLPDRLYEVDEDLWLVVNGVTNAQIASDRARAWIRNDDRPPRVSVLNTNVTEGVDREARVTVALDAPAGVDVTVSCQTEDDSAKAGTDYDAVFQALEFLEGTTGKTVAIPIRDDPAKEITETFKLVLTQAIHAEIPAENPSGIITILDDDPDPDLTISGVTVAEGNAGDVLARFKVSLSAPTIEEVTFAARTEDGTAQASEGDYLLLSESYVIPIGQVETNVVVRVVGDLLDENDEDFSVRLTNVRHAQPRTAVAIGVIQDDDEAVVNLGQNVTVVEGDSGTTKAVFDVALTHRSDREVVVRYATEPETATENVDYDGVAGTLSFPTNTTGPLQIVASVRGDLEEEPTETFRVRLLSVEHAILGKATATGVIQDDDKRVVSGRGVSVVEGNGGFTNAAFLVTLSVLPTRPVTVHYSTVAGSATPEDDDYVAIKGTLEFTNTITDLLIPVPVRGDTNIEPDETFFLLLDRVTDAKLETNRLPGVIINDDFAPVIVLVTNTLQAEDCSPANQAVDPLEEVSVAVVLENIGNVPATNVVAVMETNAVVRPLNNPVRYGLIGPHQQATNTFRFVANGECGQAFTIRLHLWNGLVELPPLEFTRVLGLNHQAHIACCRQTDLAIEAEASASRVRLGEALTYAVTVTNRGPWTATKLSMSGLWRQPVRLLSAIPTAGRVRLAPEQLDWTIDELAPGGSVELQVSTVPQAAGALITWFDVAGEQDDPNPEDNETYLIVVVDKPTGFSIGDVTVEEGHEGTRMAVFTVHLEPPRAGTVSVRYHTEDGSAKADQDYVARKGPLEFLGGATERTIEVPIIGDRLDESDEDFRVVLSEPSVATIPIPAALGRGLILDDDLARLSVADTEVLEGPPGTTNLAVFSVALLSPSSSEVTVDIATEDGTARAGVDYVPVNASLVFAPDAPLLQEVQVPVIGDLDSEMDETFRLTLSNPSNAVLVVAQGLATIRNYVPPQPPVLTLTGDGVAEGGDGESREAAFLVSLDQPAPAAVRFDYSTSGGTAESGSDYVALPPTTGLIPASETRYRIPVRLIGDHLAEPDEFFFLQITNILGAVLGQGRQATNVVGWILNDDYPAVIESAGHIVAVEGCVPTNSVVDPLEPVTLQIGLRNVGVGPTTNLVATLAAEDGVQPQSPPQEYGRLESGAPPRYRSFTLWIAGACGSIQNLRLTLTDGVERLPDVMLPLRLGGSEAGGACCENADLAVQVLDAPDPVTVGSNITYEVAITNRGPFLAPNARLEVSLDPALALLEVQTPGGNVLADGQEVVAELGDFPPGEIVTLALTVRTLAVGRPVTSFEVSSERRDPAPLDDTAVADTSVNPQTGLSLGDATVTEGPGGREARLRLSLFPVRASSVTVRYRTVDGTAVGGLDYVPTNGTATIVGGRSETTISVPILDDDGDEAPEQFKVLLSDPVPASIPVNDGEGIVTILDDDPPCLSVGDVEVNVGTTTNMQAVVPVWLSSAPLQAVSVDVVTHDGLSPTNATQGTDYVFTSGRLWWEAGTSHLTNYIRIPASANTQDETNRYESFFVVLTNPTNATLCKAVSLVTITDESPGVLFVEDVALVEGNSGPSITAFVLRLSQPLQHEASVEFATVDDTATATNDYRPRTSRITIPANETEVTVPVEVFGDRTWEGDEVFLVELRDPQSVVLQRERAQARIINDDPIPQLAVTGGAVSEGDQGTTNLVFALSLSNPSSEDIVLRVVATNGTAEAGLDYSPGSTEVAFSPGMTELFLEVAVQGDTLDEFDESVFLQLQLVTTNAMLPSPTVEGLIRDDDAPPTLAVSDPEVSEGNEGTTPAPFHFVLSSPSGKEIVMDVRTQDGTAKAGSDYVSNAVHLVFLPGRTQTNWSVAVSGDRIAEPPREIFFLTLTDLANVEWHGPDPSGAILDDDFVNQPPFVELLHPTDGAIHRLDRPLELLAEARDPDPGGSVTQVEFFQFLTTGARALLGTVPDLPYALRLGLMPGEGEYTFIARATDNVGAMAESAPATVVVADIGGDILIVRVAEDPELAALEDYLSPSEYAVYDRQRFELRTPIVQVLDRSAIDGDVLSAFRVVIWDDCGLEQGRVGEADVEALWTAWQNGTGIYLIGEFLPEPAPGLSDSTRARWLELVGMAPDGRLMGPAWVQRGADTKRPYEFFETALWGIVSDFFYYRPTRPGLFVGDGEVRASMNEVPVLIRYPRFDQFDNPFQGRRAVQTLLVAKDALDVEIEAQASLLNRKRLLQNVVLWLFGGECDNFSAKIASEDILEAERCRPFPLVQILDNNGTCAVGGLQLVISKAGGLQFLAAEAFREVVDLDSNSGGTTLVVPLMSAVEQDGNNIRIGLGRVPDKTKLVVRTWLAGDQPGAFTNVISRHANFRPIEWHTSVVIIASECDCPRLTIEQEGEETQLILNGTCEVNTVLQRSVDLVAWTPIQTNAPSQGPRLLRTIGEAQLLDSEYYRLIIPPSGTLSDQGDSWQSP